MASPSSLAALRVLSPNGDYRALKMRKSNGSAVAIGDQPNAKTAEPLLPKESMVIGPAQMAPKRATTINHMVNGLVHDSTTLPQRKKIKRKETPIPEDTTPLEARLESAGTVLPKTDNYAHLLVQGLESGDKKMLQTALSKSDDDTVMNTLGRLPLESISPLLRELQKFLYHKGDNNIIYMKWLEKLFLTRLSFILTLPNLESELAPLLQLLNVRTDVFDRLLRLKGRLNLMLSHSQAKIEEKFVDQKAQLMYEEDSSSSDEDESDADDDHSSLSDGEGEAMDLDEDRKEDKAESSDEEDAAAPDEEVGGEGEPSGSESDSEDG